MNIPPCKGTYRVHQRTLLNSSRFNCQAQGDHLHKSLKKKNTAQQKRAKQKPLKAIFEYYYYSCIKRSPLTAIPHTRKIHHRNKCDDLVECGELLPKIPTDSERTLTKLKLASAVARGRQRRRRRSG